MPSSEPVMVGAVSVWVPVTHTATTLPCWAERELIRMPGRMPTVNWNR